MSRRTAHRRRGGDPLPESVLSAPPPSAPRPSPLQNAPAPASAPAPAAEKSDKSSWLSTFFPTAGRKTRRRKHSHRKTRHRRR